VWVDDAFFSLVVFVVDGAAVSATDGEHDSFEHESFEHDSFDVDDDKGQEEEAGNELVDMVDQ
jgi:hypothetical protein